MPAPCASSRNRFAHSPPAHALAPLLPNTQTPNHARRAPQILSNNTRRTKVVELSTGTHRVPDELRKHYLSDGEAGQYSTNLDRNRYGNDDQYLFTGVRARPARSTAVQATAAACVLARVLAPARKQARARTTPRARPACCHPASGALRPRVPGPVPLHGGR